MFPGKTLTWNLNTESELSFYEKKIAECDGIEFPDGEIMKEVEQEGYIYLGILEVGRVKESQMKVMRIYKKKHWLILKLLLNKREKLQQWAPVQCCSKLGGLTRKGSDLKALDRKTGKIMTMHRVIHPKSDFDRPYVMRHKVGTGLISVEQC